MFPLVVAVALTQVPIRAASPVPIAGRTVVAMSVAAQGGRTPAPLTGVVRDQDGGAVPGAVVIVRSASGAEQQTVTGSDGRFSLPVANAGPLTVIVRVDGFAEARQSLGADAPHSGLAFRLSPAAVSESITVTPTRTEQEIGQVPASVDVISRAEIQRSPAVVADDLLRQEPTFSLFRRASSLASHPTAQGVSLRGLGPSGVSRTLVLLDGVPFNDPFGGWVHWTRVPLEAADRIEVVNGSSSSVYGNYAMGGVINIVTAPPSRRTLEVRSQYGNLDSPKVDVLASDVFGKLGVSVDGSAFDTNGYPVVVANERGPVDTNVAVNFKNMNVRMQYDVSSRVQAFFSTGYYREHRKNGKVSTVDGTPEANDTRWATASGGVRVRFADSSELQARLFGDDERFHSNFLAVSSDPTPRSFARVSLDQVVPTNALGGMVQWSRPLGTRHAFTAGLDWHWVKGESQEQVFDSTTGTRPIIQRYSGGRQRSVGFFAQDVIAVSSRFNVTLSGRLDNWRNYDGHNLQMLLPSGKPTSSNAPSLPARSDTVASPHVGALYHVSDRVSVWGSLGAGFRAPTLNELYRQYRVGSVVTLANDQLGPERLVGTEAGVRVAASDRLMLRATWFDNHLTDPVSNVTIDTTPSLVTQQRQNLGATRVSGVQGDVEFRPARDWRIEAAYLYDRARVTKFDASPDLVGNVLAQVPRHRGSVEVAYTNPKWVDLAVDVQAVGRQFDDDRNMRTVPGYSSPGLPRYAVVSLSASRPLGRDLEAFVGVQNLFNQQYLRRYPADDRGGAAPDQRRRPRPRERPLSAPCRRPGAVRNQLATLAAAASSARANAAYGCAPAMPWTTRI